MLKRSPLLLLALLVGCSPSSAPNAQQGGGQAAFKALNCGACHLIGGAGSGRGGPDLTMVGFRKSNAWLDAWLKDPQAWRPGTMMPNPHLTDPARKALVGYLSGLKGEDWGAVRPWNAPDAGKDPVERGHLLFAKAGCITCHGVAGVGGYPDNNVVGGKIPALVGVQDRFTKAELAAKIKKGVEPAKADPAGPEPLLRMPAWGQTLDDKEIGLVVDYLWTLKSKDAGKAEW